MSQEDIYDSLQPTASQPYTNAILGPTIAGGLVGLMLGGAFIQEYINYLGGKLYRRDSARLRWLLHTVILLATAQTSLIFWTAYHYATWQQRDALTLNSPTTVDALVLTFVGIEGALVQLYLAQRGTVLMGRSGWRYLYWTLVGLGVAGGVAGSIHKVVVSTIYRHGTYVWWYSVGTSLYQISAAFTDTLISITLCLTLARNIQHFNRQTDSILWALMRLSVQAAAPTAIVAVAGACLQFAVDFGAESWVSIYQDVPWAFYQVMAGLYALSLLAVLNGRERVREAAEGATQKGVYQFSRDVLTTVDGPPAAPCPTGVGSGGPGTPVVAVELAGFLEAGEAGWRPKEREEKEG